MRSGNSVFAILMTVALVASPALAQNQRIDPAPLPADTSVNGGTNSNTPQSYPSQNSPQNTQAGAQSAAPDQTPPPPEPNQMAPCIQASNTDHFQNGQGSAQGQNDTTYHKDDLIGAGEGVFGKGARGLAQIIQRTLKDQGEPNGYIVGREAAGAFIVGLRYGSGTLCHKIEGQRPVYWTGPSLGFDWGGDANKVFILVYNLYDTQDIYKRFGQIEGRAYFIGGLSATYLRKNDVVLIPIRMGVGLRLGANFGYMKIKEKGHWFPF